MATIKKTVVVDSARVGGSAQVGGSARVGGSANICQDMVVMRHLSATRSDGYTFTIAPSAGASRSGYWVTAGCRVFETLTAAREHWRSARGGTKLGDETLAILDYLERVYAIWEGGR